MTFVHPSAASLIAFLMIVMAVLAAFAAGVYTAYERQGGPSVKSASKVMRRTFAWLIILSVMVENGVLRESPMPGVLIFLGLSNLAAIALALSPLGGTLARGLPLWSLVAFQAFRLPLELVLHSWAEQGTIPSTMTWTGQNWDIITGIAALIAAPLSIRFRAAAWAFNLLGIALLLNVARVAVMSSPLPFAWGVQPPLLLAFYLPYAWIVPVCVAGALAGHIVLTRALCRLYGGEKT